MRDTMDMTKKELAVFCLMAVLSGFMIGIGGTASLLANALLGVWGRLVGAMLFSLGIYAIVTYGMKLFTGMVADIPKMGMKNMWRLPLCFFGNVIAFELFADAPDHIQFEIFARGFGISFHGVVLAVEM